MNIRSWAEYYSLQAITRSLIRDFHTDKRIIIEDEKLMVKTSTGMLSVTINYFSNLGLHDFENQILCIEEGKVEEINFLKFVDIIERDFFSKTEGNLLKKVTNSLENIKASFEIADTRVFDSPYLESEQSLYLGHSVHPYPKLKDGINNIDNYMYSPEFQNKFKLKWIKFKRDSFTSNIKLKEYQTEITSLIKSELNIDTLRDSEFYYLPFHPWQFDKIIQENRLDSEKVLDVLIGKNYWYPLSSMRSLHCPELAYQLKFSMDITLTNSIRHLQPEESIRGAQFSNIEDNIKEHCFLEPFYVSVDKRSDMTVQFRKNLKFDESKTFLLSYLNQETLYSYKSNLSLLQKGEEFEFIQKWFDSYIKNFITPILNLACKEGILLGVHQQNILLELDEENLVKNFYYRDFQGSGFSERGLEKYGKQNSLISTENGNILNDNDVNKVFGYYFIINNVFATINALANKSNYYESYLLRRLKNFLSIQEKNNFIEYLLESPTLWQKGNFRCCINEFNENTLKDPWSIYNKIDNPLFKIESKKYECIEYQAKYKDHLIEFVPLDIDRDLELFYNWQNQDFVSEFWELDLSKDELKAYLKSLVQSPFQDPYIYKVNGEAVGYFEFYWAIEDRIAPFAHPKTHDRGLHLLIGNKKFLNTRFVYLAMLHASKFLFEQNPLTQNIFGEPRSDNKKILKFCEKLPGWRFIKEFDFPHKRAALLECNRERFYHEYL